MFNRLGDLSIRNKLLLSGLTTLVMVLVAVVVSSFGYRAIQRASDATLFHAQQSTSMQMLIKDINQLVMTEGAKAVRARLAETVERLNQQFAGTVRSSADEAARKAAGSWGEVKVGIEDLLTEQKISMENDAALGKVVKLQARLDGLAGEVGQLADGKRAESERIAAQVVTVVGAIFAAILLSIAVGFFFLYRSLRAQLGAEPALVRDLVKRVADGDLMVAIDARAQSTSLLGAMGEMTGKLTTVVRSIDDTNRKISQAAFQISLLSREQAASNQVQEERGLEVAAATEELSAISATVRELAEAARGRAAHTETQAADGIRAVRESVDTMQKTVGEVEVAAGQLTELSAAASQINEIIDSISAIATQTNLLSLNAAIEAARAGEQGRGFAVVADEVRKLANRTTEATAQINRIVSALTGQIGLTRSCMNNVVDSARVSNEKTLATGVAIERIVDQVRQNDEGNIDIAKTSQAQTERLQVLNQTIATLFQTLRDNQAKTGVTHQISDDLYRTVEVVTEQLTYFEFDRSHKEVPRDSEQRKYPRSQNALLVTVDAAGKTHKMIAEDFSVSGMRLRACGTDENPPSGLVTLQVMRPQDNFEAFARQQPVRIDGRIVWQRRVGEDTLYGVDFVNRTPAQEQEIVACFEYFRSSAYFS